MEAGSIKAKVDKIIDSQEGHRRKVIVLPQSEWEELLKELKPTNLSDYYTNPIESNGEKHCIFYRRTAIYIKTEEP